MGKKLPRLVQKPAAEMARCLTIAQQFLDASARCADERVAGFVPALHAPAVANAAFAVELAFKALLLRQLQSGDPAPDGHTLEDLFRKLLPTEQASLRADTAVPTYPRFETPSADPFGDALREHTNAFVAWRYVHEERGTNLAASVPFLSSLAAAAIALS